MLLQIKKKPKPEVEETTRIEIMEPKYPKPKILLIDIKDNSKDLLLSEGYNVSEGTFGTPYKVKKADSLLPVIINQPYPDCYEQEIVVIDLVPGDSLDGPTEEKCVSDGENDWWASCSAGIIDPRPRAMAGVHEELDRILKYGGIFIVFAAPRLKYEFIWGYYEQFRGITKKSDIPYHNWSFLSTLHKGAIRVSSDRGEEIKSGDLRYFDELISKFASGSYFSCTFSPVYIQEKNWIVLARNKYGDAVAVLIRVDSDDDKEPGHILIFPQIQNKADFLLELMKDPFPRLAPHLFPHIEKAKWIYQQEYESREVIGLKEQIEEIQKQTEVQIEEIRGQISKVREENKYLYDLLTGTDRELVEAVMRALGILGFKEIVDVDKELKDEGGDASLREDIQIKDRSPVLIVDVKGIMDKPSDSEAMQSHKHATIRMKEWNRTDINSLTIVNHQRHLPPLERDNTMPYRQEILDGASQVDLGLMTAWDLYRLVRSFLKNGWKPEHVKPLLYQAGRISIIPLHYQYVGVVKHIWKNVGALSIQIENLGFKKGDRIDFELPIQFEEQVVESMQLNNQDVSEARIGDEIGIKTDLTKPPIRSGIRTYLVG
jgi:hypothetical protein